LFHDLAAPGTGTYFNQLCCLLEGTLDPVALARAFQTVVDRHAILRTAFVWDEVEEPLQIVCREVSVPIRQEDWRGLDAAQRRARLEAFLEEDRRRGFDLGEAPLLRLALFRETDTAHRFVFSNHHLLMDGWSLPLVLGELFALYDGFGRGVQVPLPEPRPFRDFIGWLQRQDLSASEAYWRRVLGGFRAPTPVPSTLEGQAREGGGGEVEVILGTEATAALQGFARARGVTLSTLVQGAWALLLARYSGEGDVVFGATVSGRPPSLSGVESIVGMFINTLPVRVSVEPEQRLDAWLSGLQARAAELMSFEHSPLVSVRGWSDVPAGAQLFDSIVVFENYPRDAALVSALKGLRASEVQMNERTNFPLTLAAAVEGGLMLRLQHDARLDRAGAERVLGHLSTLLRAMPASAGRRLGELSLVDPDERRELLQRWNGTRREYAGEALLHREVEAQAKRAPDAVAVAFEGATLTYRALEERANRLARHLKRKGVGPDVVVGVLAERSLELVVALLGVLKAGGAYLPLEPSYPRERLAMVLEDGRPALVVVTHAGLLAALPEARPPVVCLDTDAEELSKETAEAQDGGALPDNLAYVLFTSGSTGRPKGVAIAHRAVWNHVRWMAERFPLGADDVVLQQTPFGFDVSVWEIFGSLCAGVRLVLARPGGHRETAYLAELIAAESV
ncbi:MAG TPA: condensation domain-containing protein, partial [Myxococcaceae bacterium]|nr:condensation domain-containing protein [Myxococcaceae bacterium]